MTTSTIHPVIIERLEAFARRRKRFLWMRGVCGTAAIWFGAMMLVALLDRLVVIPDRMRLALSFAGYVAAGAMFWFTCGRRLAHAPNKRELARLVEFVEPDLHEGLISAVELGEDAGAHWDSDAFRAVLQRTVAARVNEMSMETLLTERLISGWLYTAIGVFGVFFVLAVIPGLRFGQAFVRAVAPTANIARVSITEVTAVKPGDSVVPEGDNIPVTVTVSGNAGPVQLETATEQVPMSLSAPGRFMASLQVERTPVQYRIRAGDAVTRKYTLDTRPRPHVVRFTKTYRYPPYSNLSPRTITEENGELAALEGTDVELDMEIDQPVKEASLRLDTGDGKSEIGVTPDGAGHLRARVPMRASGTYQVHLIAAQTSFENKYSPQYELRSQPDLVPSAKIDRPEQEAITTTPDGAIDIQGHASDDLALAGLAQAIQINGGAWRTVPIPLTTGATATVTRRWDLLDLNLRPGDRVLTKLVATDLKGQTGDSNPLRLTISSPGFDPQRLRGIETRRALQQALTALREAAQQYSYRAKDAAAAPATDDLSRKQTALAAAAARETVEQQADTVLRLLRIAIPDAKSVRDSTDFILIGRTVSRLRHDPQAGTLALARAAEDTHRQLLAADEAAMIVRDLAQLSDEQRAPDTDDPHAQERRSRREAVVAEQTRFVREMMDTLATRAGVEPTPATMRIIEQQLSQRADEARAALRRQAGSTADALAGLVATPVRWPSVLKQLRDRADLEEHRATGDAQFVADTGLAAEALAAVTNQTELLKVVEAAYRKLETGYEVVAVVPALRQLSGHERWDKPTIGAVLDRAREWSWADLQMQALPANLTRARLPAAQAMADTASSPPATNVREEMTRRVTQPGSLNSLAAPLDTLAGNVTAIQLELKPTLDAARMELEKLAPKLSERLKTIEEAREALRRDANRQDLATEAGRERARDADDALAMLRQTNALAQIAEHFANLEAGKPDDTRAALREAESQLGLKGALDAEYAKAQHIAELATASPPDALKELEKELVDNTEMRRELSTIAQQAVAAAQAGLQQAASNETQIASGIQPQSSLSTQAQQIAAQAGRLAQAVAPLSRSAQQELQSVSQNMPRDFSQSPAALAAGVSNQVSSLQQAAQTLTQAGNQLTPSIATAQQAVSNATQQLRQAMDAQTAAPQSQSAAESVANAAAAQSQAQSAAQAAQATQRNAQQAGQQASQLAEQAAQLADALAQQQAQMNAAATQQPAIEQAVRDAGGDLARAGRHEERLDQAAAGEQLQQLGEQIQNQTAGQVAQAQQAMQGAASPTQAQSAAQGAAQAIQQAAAQAQAAAGQNPSASPGPGQASPAASASQWMARALDSLDSAGPSAGVQAMAAAAQAQAAAMMAARGTGVSPGQKPSSTAGRQGSGASFDGGATATGALPEAGKTVAREWGRLPPKLAHDLMESQREGVAGEYREQVDTYFRAIAEKSREKQP